MSKKINLSSGATVTIKDAANLKVKDRNRIVLAGNGASDAEKGIAIGNALLVTIIEDWSYDLMVPSVKEESIEELPIKDYVELMKHTEDLTKDLFPDLADTDKNRTNPDSPLENSKDLKGFNDHLILITRILSGFTLSLLIGLAGHPNR